MSRRKHVLQQRLSSYASTNPGLNKTNGERHTIVGKPEFVVTRAGASTVISPLMIVVTPVQVFRVAPVIRRSLNGRGRSVGRCGSVAGWRRSSRRSRINRLRYRTTELTARDTTVCAFIQAIDPCHRSPSTPSTNDRPLRR